MIEAGEVGAVFRVVDEATVILQRLARQFKELDALVLKTKESVAKLGTTTFGTLTERLGAIGAEFARVGGASGDAAALIASNFGKADLAIDSTIERVALLSKSMKESLADGRALAARQTGGIRTRAARAEGEVAARRVTGPAAATTGRIEAASAALVKLGTTSTDTTALMAANFGNASAAIDTTIERVGLLGKEMRDVAAQSRAMGRISGSGMAGGFGGAGSGGSGRPNMRYGGGGHGGSGGGNIAGPGIPLGPVHMHTGHNMPLVGAAAGGFLAYEAFKYSAELVDSQERMKIAGVTPAKIAEATTLSYKIAEQFGQPAKSVLDTINEIRNPLGGIDPAMEHIKALGSAMVVLRSQDAKTGGGTASELYDLVKSAEFRNAITPETFDKAIDSMVRADVATGGRVSPREFVQMSKMMKAALPGLSDEFLYSYAPELAQEFKGSSAGTALASLYQQVVAGQMRTTGLRLLDTLGEIDESKAEFDKNGRIVRTKPGANKLGDMFKRDPGEYAAQLIADLTAHGISAEGDQRDWMTQIFGNRNAAQMAMTLGYQRMRLDRGAAGIGQTMHVDDASKELLANDPKANIQAASSAYENMMASLGVNFIGPVTQAMKDVTTSMNAVGEAKRGDFSSDFWKFPAGPVKDLAAKVAGWFTGGNGDGGSIVKRVDGSPQSLFGYRERNRAESSLYQAGYRGADLKAESSRETSRGFAQSPAAAAALAKALPAPQVKVDTKVDVKVTLDGAAIAAKVESRIVSSNRAVNGASDHDSGAAWSPPDMGK